MLTQLTINNFAIVRQLEIELAKGMSVITGETGAGKSIAIDALGLCLGQRIETSMVREGQERAESAPPFLLNQRTPLINGCKSKNCRILIILPIVFYAVSSMQMGVLKPLLIARLYRLLN